MKLNKPLLLSTVIALMVLLVFQQVVQPTAAVQPAAEGQDAGRTFYVTVPQTAVAEATQLGLTPEMAWDYGSFHWLAVNQADFTSLTNSGLPVTWQQDAGTLQVTRYRFDPLAQGEPALPESERMTHDGKGFRLIQMHGPTNNARLDALAATGVEILQYYPHYTYLVWGSAAETAVAESLDFVRWQGAFHPAYKINPDLDNRIGLVKNVDIFFYNDGDVKATLAQIAALGGTILDSFPAQPDRLFYTAIVELDAAAFADVAQLNTVLWFGHIADEPGLDDEMSSQIVAGNHLAGVPFVGYAAHLNQLGYDGDGVRWATIDTGVDYNHPDLGPRIVAGYSFPGACNPPGQPGQDCNNGGHGTHVAGIIGGDATAGFTDANGFLYGMGMAPGHDIVALNPLVGNSWPPAGGWQENSKQAVLLGAVGGNNSWHTGEGSGLGYRAPERTHDLIVRDGNFDTADVAEPFIQVFSAGNSGPGPTTLTAPKEAKNMIIVGSSLNYRAGNINTISGFSSRGPAVDGRLGVTIAAPGSSIASARNTLGGSSCTTAISGTNNMYAFCSGTSMAAPHAAGTIVLATEWWRGFNGGEDPSPAMAKALLVNAATPMGVIPNTNEGWGRINVTNIISPTAHTIYYDQTHLFTETGQQWILAVGVADPSQPLKITLAWSDAPGAVGANPALVNNLDLTVINGGNTYLGNVFSGGWSTTGGTADTLNNLENVYIQNPGGSATIIIDATNIAGDGVPYNGELADQDFALICSNCALFPDFTLTATPSSQSICVPSSAAFDLTVGQILGFDDPVTLSVDGQPGGTTADFSTNPVTPPGSSVLTIGNTGAAAAGSYALEITGEAPTSTHSVTVNLNVFTQAPGVPALTQPANGATNVALQPTLTWNAASQGESYTVEIATDVAFTDIVESATVTGNSYTTDNLNSSSVYYWRVRSANSCGGGSNSTIFTFSTEALPGDCGPGTEPVVWFSDDFESGASGWTSGGTQNTWQLSDNRSNSGDFSYYAENVGFVSDQRLVSPPVALPADGQALTLQFYNYQHMESRSGGCWDGSILEISTNAGATWTQVPNSKLLTDPYDGPIASGYSNPLTGLDAWCGDPQDWLNSVVDIADYAGETVQFRFRLGTDNVVSREGWYVDDVKVQSCVATTSAVLTPSSEVTVLPGETAVHEFILTNTGLDDTYDIALEAGEWDMTLLTSSPLTLTTGMTATISVAVETPMLLGSDSFTLTVTSQSEPTLVRMAMGVTHVKDYEAALTASSEVTTSVGETAVHEFMLTNIGLDDTYDLAISGGDWDTVLQTGSPLTVSEGMTATIAVAVDTPLLVGSDSFTLTVTSQGNPMLVLTAVGTTHTDAVVVLSSSSEVTTSVGETAVHEFMLLSIGLDDTYDLAISGGDWDTVLQTGSPLTVSNGITATIAVAVDTPLFVGSDSFTLTITSQADPTLVLMAVGTTHTEAEAGLAVSGDSELWGTAGMTTTHTLVVTNTGELTDTFTLEMLPGHSWTTWTDEPDTGPLAPGDSATIQVHVLVGSGPMDVATLRLRSSWDTAVYADVTLTTHTNLVYLPLIIGN
jgi:subtilisin family serine protease